MTEDSQNPSAARERGKALARTFIDGIHAKHSRVVSTHNQVQEGREGPIAWQTNKHVVNVPVPRIALGFEIQVRLTFLQDAKGYVWLTSASQWRRRERNR